MPVALPIAPHAVALERALERSKLQHLARTLRITRDSVEQVWATNKLPWFTDHSHGHSQRVSKLAHRLATVRRVGAQNDLNLLERYVLEMAAWVHDVGMQHIGAPDSEGQVTILPKDAREQHPRASHDALMGDLEDGFQLEHGIPRNDDSIVQYIALLALSHGTHTYRDAMDELKKFDSIYDYPLRSERLAPLLLMADELDLTSERVKTDATNYQMSTLSNAHWLRHECVDSLKIDVHDRGFGEGPLVRASLTLKSYENIPENDTYAIGEWISDKLIAQIAMTEPEMTAGYAGLYRFDRRIDISIRDRKLPSNPRATPKVLAMIKADNAKARLIDHTTCANEAKNHLSSGTSLVLVGKGLDEEDQDGRDDLFDLLCADARVAGTSVRKVRTAQVTAHILASDLIALWLGDARLDERSIAKHDDFRRDLFLEALVRKLSTETAPTLLALSNFSNLRADQRQWLLAEALPRLNAIVGVTILLSSNKRLKSDDLDGAWAQVAVGKTPAKDLLEYMAKHRAAAAGKGLAQGLTYTQARSHRATALAGIKKQ